MTYSSALFAGDLTRSLEDAQVAKYERILTLLDPRRGSRILEIGCGWGGFAEYAARTRGCSVHGITISRRQLELAQGRIRDAGLSGRVALEFRDYRDLQGRYDHVVSIEMYETVGERFWPTYFGTLRERLKPGGRAVVQAITIADERFDRYRSSTDFIQQFIFPGGMLASPSVLRAQAERAGLAVRSTHAFGLDYAETLRRWNQRFNRAWREIHADGFDEHFKRLWNFYLSYCEAGFRSRSTDVLQVEMSHA
jgi:cyclopropane-fatty-acyl-phospholipid synthase